MSTTTNQQSAPDHTTPTEPAKLAPLTGPAQDIGLGGGDSELAAPVSEASEAPGKPLTAWTGPDHETYLDTRPHGGLYNPAAEYGDPDWREPESDTEAAARTAHLAAAPRDPETEAWRERVAALSRPGQDSLEAQLWEAEDELYRAGHFHDPDEITEARARRDQLAARLATLELVSGDAEPRLRDAEITSPPPLSSALHPDVAQLNGQQPDVEHRPGLRHAEELGDRVGATGELEDGELGVDEFDDGEFGEDTFDEDEVGEDEL